ncbi:NACHT domain-containing protein [Micromonospora sp. NBC_01739]|uniref:NACHT domain-containing protein n=1 Tax=Micromonospora sp. NBC_01739 TaxID=2975985 RepID=UPI002E1230FF|nr:NACHT domain-containing protein [Micromonospora sp. NBC_01739]
MVLYVLARSLHDNDVLEGLDKVFSIIGGMSGLLGLALTVRAVRSADGPAGTRGGQADSSGLDGLATAVEQVWRPELHRRRLANPHPLPVAWTTIGPPIADHWSNIRSDGDPTPLNLDDCLDLRSPDALHQVLTDERLRGRVILLGEPGAGKTTLLLREALRLLRARTPEDRVPVLLRLPTWNPDEQTLEQWITAQLATEYGHRSPITTSQLLPLLDGLDEMPAPRRARAVQAINNTFDPDQPLVLTSRTTEYLDTLTGLPGTTMAAAAVLELTTIAADVACAYLQRTTNRPGDWEAAFDRDTDGRLASALNAPLWVDLARLTHTDPHQPDNQPGRLLDLPDTVTIRTHLLDRLIPAAYPDPPEPDPTGHTWHRADADRYLRNLAHHMHRRNTHDLAWWELVHTLPRPIRLAFGPAFGLTLGSAIGLAFGLPLGVALGHRLGLLLGLILGLTSGIAFLAEGGFTFGLAFGNMTPSRRQIIWRWSSRSFLRRNGSGLVAIPVVGLVGWLVVGLSGAFVAALVLVLIVLLAHEASTSLNGGDAEITASDPLTLLRNDRRRALANGLAYGLACGLTFGIAFGIAVGLLVGLTLGLTVGLMLGLTVGLTFGLSVGFVTASWGPFQYARLWWCMRKDLPWPLMAFLADAHRRGVLRQAGGVYQFRHSLLRDRLI